MNVHLKVVQGKPHHHRLHFSTGEFFFGRGPECHVRPNSELVSRQHCMLKVAADGALSIRDLGSANGTLVNGRRVVGEQALVTGDTLQLGPVILQVVDEEAPVADILTGETICKMGDTAVSESAVSDRAVSA